MSSSARDWDVKKLIDRCSRRPAEEAAWREFVRRFHTTIQSSVSNVLTFVTENENVAREGSFDDVIDDLVQDVYRRLAENNSAALRRVSCTGTDSMKNYLLLISINAVRAHFRAATKDASSRSASANTGIPFGLLSPPSHQHPYQRSDSKATHA
jgi:DNA-directed RNA polymerase specialized sigma24 family protein